MLKLGSKGQVVKDLQRALSLTSDGIFGPKTEIAVKEFQKKNGLVVDGIVGPKTLEKIFGKQEASEKTSLIQNGKAKRKITRIILHCTAGWLEQTTEDIKAYWKSIGWKNVGYHYLIGAESYEQLADEDVVTNGVSGYNSNSIHVCYKGGIEKVNGKIVAKDTRTEYQKQMMLSIVKELKKRYPNATIHGHNEFAAKDCPSFNVKKWLQENGI